MARAVKSKAQDAAPASGTISDGDDDLLDEAVIEHAGVQRRMEQIESMDIGGALYDAKVRVLDEEIKHHCDLDLQAPGKRLYQRKMQLMTRTGAARR